MDTPLSATETGLGWTLRALNLSDYFYKTYLHDGMAVRLYVAYWAPGQMDPRVVWSHQPDVCWMSNGASILTKDDDRVLPGEGDEKSLGALYRIFQFPQGKEEVVFWHLVGKKLSGYQSSGTDIISSKWQHFARSLRLSEFGLSPQEQLVVRISTNRTISDVLNSALWPALATSLGSSGIFGPTTELVQDEKQAGHR